MKLQTLFTRYHRSTPLGQSPLTARLARQTSGTSVFMAYKQVRFSLVVSFATIGLTVVPRQLLAQVAADAVVYGPSHAEITVVTKQGTQVALLRMMLDTITPPADGVTQTRVTLQLVDAKGKPVKDEVFVTLESTAGRIVLDEARTDEFGPGAKDANSVIPGVQLLVKNGQASFGLLSPSVPQQGVLRASIDAAKVEAKLQFMPEQRPWIVNGLIEGVIALRKTNNESLSTPIRSNDGFEDALKHFEKSFNDGQLNLGARAAFFVKGTISGQTLLTASYDSDKETRERMLRDIKADEIYPVFGDASIKGFEAQSTQRLYVRVDNGKHYALYGDFQTGDGFSQQTGSGAVASLKQRDLGSYNRSLTGVKAHYEAQPGFLNAFVVNDSLTQLVEEFSASGTSFYNTRRADIVENSEKIEQLVRDRNNPARILKAQLLVRFVDYTFEPFNGRILLKSPISSTDVGGNPQSLRISYEVDQRGEKYWIMGLDGQLKLGAVEAGVSVVKDQNPMLVSAVSDRKLTELISVNASLNLGTTGKLIAEVARSKNDSTVGELVGQAHRIEFSFGKGAQEQAPNQAVQTSTSNPSKVSGAAYFAKADDDFYNPSASMNQGRQEAGANIAIQVGDKTTLKAEVVHNEVSVTQAQRKLATVGMEYQAGQTGTVLLGLKQVQDNGKGLFNSSQPSAMSLFGAGGIFNPSSTGTTVQSTQLGIATGLSIDTTTAMLGYKNSLTAAVQYGVELETNVEGDKAHRYAWITQWQMNPRTKLGLRYEVIQGLGGYVDRNSETQQLTVGITNGYLNQGAAQGELFSEYRLRDALGGREGQLATGLRNTVDVSKGLKLSAALERLTVLQGDMASTWSLATGVDYTANELWKSSARLEYRVTDTTGLTPGSTGLLSTLSLARKLTQQWTMLARNYFARSDNQAIAGEQSQHRIQFGAAYRPIDAVRFDALGMVEYRVEKNGETAAPESRKVWVLSTHANWHPQARLWVSGRLATKSADEVSSLGSYLFEATLLSGRVIYDVNEQWDVGFMTSAMMGGGAKQYAYGLEAGKNLAKNIWLSAGFNFSGFTDKDLTGNEYTSKGLYMRLRMKFNANTFLGY